MPETYDHLEGHVVLVTGANRGIGRAIADQLVELGATVYAGTRRPASVDATDRRVVRLDVTEEADISAGIDRIEREHGRLDILVNNAAIPGPAAPLDDSSSSEVRRTLETNLVGPTLITKYSLPLLTEREGGRVINLSTEMGTASGGMDGGAFPAYRISKMGLNALTLYLAGEYESDGLMANSVNPGKVDTRMGGPEATRSPAEGAATVTWLARLRPGGPSGHLWKDRNREQW